MKKSLLKSPVWPALLSAIGAPGFGQFLNGDITKGVFLLGVFLGALFWFTRVMTQQLMLILSLSPDQWKANPIVIQQALMKIMEQYPGMFLTFQLLLLVVWGYSIIDAYVVAKKKPLVSVDPV